MIPVGDAVLVRYSINTGKKCVDAINLNICGQGTVKNRVEKEKRSFYLPLYN